MISQTNIFLIIRNRNQQANWESLYVGLKQDTDDIAHITFENEEMTSSLFNDEDIEHSIHKTYQIHKKYIVSSIKSGMVIVDQQRAHQRVLYEQFLVNMTVHQASSQQLLFPLNLFFSSSEMELIQDLQVSLKNTGYPYLKKILPIILSFQEYL